MVDVVTGRAAAESLSAGDFTARHLELTETEKYVEQRDEQHGQGLDDEARLSHPKWARANARTTGKEMGRDGDRVRCGR
jgi:hypothetical protein